MVLHENMSCTTNSDKVRKLSALCYLFVKKADIFRKIVYAVRHDFYCKQERLNFCDGCK